MKTPGLQSQENNKTYASEGQVSFRSRNKERKKTTNAPIFIHLINPIH